jgi:alpha-1,3-glucosyltransferase
MAITYELPLKEWYFEKTSIWTLDYPPFFAYFEWLLARPAAVVDREMVRVQNLEYGEKSVIFYQRATVIVSDLLFVYGCVRYF